MARNAAARNFLLSTVSKDKDEEKKYNSRTGKLKSEEAYKPKKSKAKAAERSAPSLLSQGQRVDVVKDTGAKSAIAALLEQQRRKQAINKQMKAVGQELRKSGATDFASYQKAAQKQMELQKQLPGASFAAGLLNSMGKSPAKIVANASGNEQLKNTWGKTLNQLQETQEANRGAGMAGAMTGEMLKAGAGYATIGKVAEKKTLDAAGKVLGGKALTKGGEIATRMIGQTVADTAVNTPITIAAGMAEGKEGRDIAKDIGKQVAMDAAFNVGLEGIGQAAKAIGKVKAAKKATETAEAVKQADEPVKQVAEKVVQEDAAKTAKQEKISETAAAMKEGRNILARRMTKEERQALELEHANLQNASYRQKELQRISTETGGDPAAIREANRGFDERMKEIERELAAQEALRTDAGIDADLTDEVGKIFGFGEDAKGEVGRILKQVMEEARNGGVTVESRNKAFYDLLNRMPSMGADSRKLADALKNRQLFVGVDAAADIADITTWNKAMKGKLGKIKIGRESNIEAFYADLRKEFPMHFPESIDDPAKMLKQIRKVAEDISAGKDISARDLKDNFNRALDRLGDTQAVKQEYREAVQGEMEGFRSNLLGRTDYSAASAEDVAGWHDELYRLQQNVDRLPDDLTKTEHQILEGMLNGDYTEEMAQQLTGPRFSLVKQHYEAQKPLKEVEGRIIGHKNYVHQKKYEEVASTVGEIHVGKGQANAWKDKATGFQYGRETLDRNLRDIIPDKQQAEDIIRMTADRVHISERDRMLMIRDYKNQIRDLGIDTRKNIDVFIPGMGQKKVSESFLIQWLGENEYALKQMMDSGVGVDAYGALQKEVEAVRSVLTPDQAARINRGIDTLRGIYEELHPRVNDAMIRNGYDPIGYIEGYFPHMDFDDPTGGMEKAASMLGFDFVSKELPMDIAGRTDTFRPGKKWSGNTLTREGTKTDYDALRAFDLYIDNIGDIIYHTDNIQTMRNLEDYVRYTTSDEGLKAQIDAVRNNKELDQLAKQEQIDKLYEEKGQDHKLQNFVNYLRTYTDLLAGKKHRVDRGLETELVGRKVYKFLNDLENRVAGNMVAGNIGSALTNFIPITQAIGSVGPKNGLRGMAEALANFANKGELDELTRKSAFLTTREAPELLYRTKLQKASEVIGSPMAIADKFTTQAVWRGRFYDNLEKGLSEAKAIRDADDFARSLFAGRSKGAMPTVTQSKVLKPFTMFQLEVNNQLSYLLKDIPREKHGDMKRIFGTYAGIAMGAYLYNDFYEKLTGRRSALDPFGIANDAIGDMTGKQMRNTVDIVSDILQKGEIDLTENVKKKKAGEVVAGLTEDIGGNVPFIGGIAFDGGRIPVQSALPSATTAISAMAAMRSGDEAQKEKAKQDLKKELEKPLWYLASPIGGGGQARKTVQGLKTMMDGGRMTKTSKGEEVQFAVDQDNAGEWMKSLLFGQWATEGGKAYIEDNSTKLGVNQTETYEKLVAAGAKNTTAFEEISRVKNKDSVAAKRTAVRASKLTDQQKAIVYRDLVASDPDKEILDHFGGSANLWGIAECMSRMAETSKTAPKRATLRNAALTDSEKRYLYLYRITGKDSREKELGRVNAFSSAGLDMNDYLDFRNKFSEVDDSGMKSAEKQQAVVGWMRNRGFSEAQMQTVRENFKFSGGYTINWKY